jgi:hypothetical protein
LVVTQDANFNRDVHVSRDIITTGNLNISGFLTASLSEGYVWVGGTGNITQLVSTSSFGTSGATAGSGSFTGSFTGSFEGDGSGLTGVTASMRPDDYDFNSEPFAGSIGYIQGSGSLYKVATPSNGVEFRYNDVAFATFTTGSTSLYGIGDILSFSGSVADRLAALEYSASILDAGTF